MMGVGRPKHDRSHITCSTVRGDSSQGAASGPLMLSPNFGPELTFPKKGRKATYL